METDDLVRAVRDRLEYSPQTGLFVWKKGRFPGRPAGSKAKRDGHLFITIAGKTMGAHRWAWLYCYGEMPSGEVDHINCVPDDNRIENLRDVSRGMNLQNRKTGYRNNTSGYLGVSWDKANRRWLAQISVNGKVRCVGRDATAEGAYEKYLIAKRSLHAGNTI